MAKFIAIRDNFGYNGTYWREGDTVTADKAPNEHFAIVKEEKVEEPAKAPATAPKTTKGKTTKKA